VPYFVGISSSVVNSQAGDFYAVTKRTQERLFMESAIRHAVLRPTLMFGWFDRKHLGWLRHFMDRSPIFPVPGDGRFQRQPLYAGDFVAIVHACIEQKKEGVYDISGLEPILYIDIVRTIHRLVGSRAKIVPVPYRVFWALLWAYTFFDRNPPFTTRQLEALVLREAFPVIDWPKIFGVTPTPLHEALAETYLNSTYSGVVLEF
jgi:nucleoside-diphosphate-sugar epimerase